jgi:hypothetical protein
MPSSTSARRNSRASEASFLAPKIHFQITQSVETIFQDVDSFARRQIRIDASLTNAKELAASLSYRGATRRHF